MIKFIGGVALRLITVFLFVVVGFACLGMLQALVH